jgi:hypothetical protein
MRGTRAAPTDGCWTCPWPRPGSRGTGGPATEIAGATAGHRALESQLESLARIPFSGVRGQSPIPNPQSLIPNPFGSGRSPRWGEWTLEIGPADCVGCGLPGGQPAVGNCQLLVCRLHWARLAKHSRIAKHPMLPCNTFAQTLASDARLHVMRAFARIMRFYCTPQLPMNSAVVTLCNKRPKVCIKLGQIEAMINPCRVRT